MATTVTVFKICPQCKKEFPKDFDHTAQQSWDAIQDYLKATIKCPDCSRESYYWEC